MKDKYGFVEKNILFDVKEEFFNDGSNYQLGNNVIDVEVIYVVFLKGNLGEKLNYYF